jgi:hypothetical protein
MSLEAGLKKLEKDINDELKSLKLPAYFEIKKFDAKTKGLEHNIGFFEVVSNDILLKIYEVFRKHEKDWRERHHYT